MAAVYVAIRGNCATEVTSNKMEQERNKTQAWRKTLLVSFIVNEVVRSMNNLKIPKKMKHFSEKWNPHVAKRKLGRDAASRMPESNWQSKLEIVPPSQPPAQ